MIADVKKNRKLLLTNARNTQNENRAETITLVVPEEYESFNKKIVFITPDGNVWDIITNNEYKITNAITKYKEVQFYIWLTKEIDGETIDFRTKTETLEFYNNKDASGEITPEEISGVTTVVNLLEEEIEKVENLNIEATKIGNTTTVIITKKDGTTESVEINDGEDGQDGQDGQDGYTPQKGIDYFTEQDVEEIEGDILNEVYTKSETDTLLEGKADTTDIPDVSSFITKDVNNLTNYTLKTNTGSLIDLEINDTTYVVTLKLKNQDGTIISTDTIDLPLESVVVSGRYDNTTKKVILTLENGSEVDFSVADLVAGLQTEITSQNKLASDLVDDTNSGNKFVTTSEKNTWNAKYDKPSGGIPKTDLASDVQTSLGKADTAIQEHQSLTDYVKNTDYATTTKAGLVKVNGYGLQVNDGQLIGLSRTKQEYDNAAHQLVVTKGTLENVIEGKQLINQTQLDESQSIQDEQIEKLKATLPTTTGEGQDITLDKTAEFKFIKPPLPIGNSEQESTTGKNLFKPISTATRNGITFTNNGDGSYTLSGTSTNNTSFYIGNVGLGSGQYALSANNAVANSKVILQLETSGGNKNFNLSDINSSQAFNCDDVNVLVVIVQNETTLNNFVIKPQLELGSSATSFEKYTGGEASPSPSYPQEITNVTGAVEVKGQNKNIVKIDNVEQTTINGLTYSIQNGILTINGTANNGTSIILANNISLKQGTYTHSINDIKSGMYFSYDNISNTMLRVLSGTKEKSKTFQLAENTIYNRYIFWIDNGTSFNNEKFYLQTEKNSTATEWNTHQEQTLPLTLGNIELCKIGDYQDYFYKESNKWYLHKEIGKTIYDGSIDENWTYYQGIIFIDNDNIRSKGSNVINLDFYTNYFKTGINKCYISHTTGQRLHVNLNIVGLSEITSVNDWKTWLSTHNTIVYYELATPTDTEITDTTLISQLEAINNAISYEEQTNISGTSDGSNPIFNVEAYQNTKLILQDISNAIVALGGV